MRVVIADDEKYVRLALKDTLQHLTIPIEIVGEAADGREAYDICLAHRPDILITDICMPEEDGFVLLEKIRKDFPELPIIIYSGYDNFSYAQRAIRYRIAEYLLKPIDEEELEKAIKNIQSFYMAGMFERKLTIYNEILHSIINCKQNESILDWQTDASEENRREFFMNVKGHTMEMLCIQGNYPMEKRKWEDYFKENIVYSWCMDEEQGVLLVICEMEEQKNILSAATEIWKRDGFLHEFRTLTDEFMEDGERFAEIRNHWIEMNKQIQFYFWDDYQSGRTEGTAIPTNQTGEQYNQNYLDQMNAAIRLGKKNYLKEVEKEYWDGLLVQFQWSNPVFVKSTMKNFLGRTMLLLDLSVGACEQISRYMKKVSRVLKADQVFELMMECVDQLFEFYQRENAGNIVDSTKEVIEDYLEKHYHQEIALEQLAEYLHFNPNYTSSLFKKIFGKTFISYLTDMRMEKAKSLLKREELRIYEVARMVGYEDERYFQKTFKKITGVTPKEYRKRKKNQYEDHTENNEKTGK